ncbi:hypothetical protein KAFR_0J00690 [Kazachstania africana CBS 2517]|uniref:Zn(2)-C6 fungal-type domain-containing protein n=1 Tax=Kazachstania africana (strain ATCC 22294 / BCRC 22015 / CBS 2517 / CECT 1963 / NBRC 1671 / NRRL Y-8276) TaxID=1071382 RepID=H2B0I7_KAZAF|nr:hypothetical protein KAFR_0J00690 [Kazachstania africana CBS 2517]CCF60137.1 hypothetical protein KAFR_0J00690 [Kazachstania africana CBS 2517]
MGNTKGENRVSKTACKKCSKETPHLGIPKSRSACKRCRAKKIKCDQEFPSCGKCAKVNEPCVSIDPATGEDIPRSYVLFLEDRLSAMMRRLKEFGVDPAQIKGNIPATSNDDPCNLKMYKNAKKNNRKGGFHLNDDLLASFLIKKGKTLKREPDNQQAISPSTNMEPITSLPETGSSVEYDTKPLEFQESNDHFSKLGSSKMDEANSFLGDSSGISFAKLVLTAANFSPESLHNEADEEIEQNLSNLVSGEAIESSLKFAPLDLPTREEAERWIVRFFIDTNSQLPIFHRELFLKKYFEPVYGPWNPEISLVSDSNKINTAFELPESMLDSARADEDDINIDPSIPWYNTWETLKNMGETIKLPSRLKKPFFFLNIVFAIGHSTQVLLADTRKVVTFKKRALHFSNVVFSSNDRLEALAGTLLLADYSIMRPSVPGVWYLMGSVLRLTVDLGLHSEILNSNYDPFTREIRRRLFWSVYALDRQVCSYFGRPFGIPEENITTRYPSILDDSVIVAKNFVLDDYSDATSQCASSKVIAMAMFKVRKIQADIVKILYAPNSELPRGFSDFEQWRDSARNKLDKWYSIEVPKSFDAMNCKFNIFFFDLNYHYSKLILYGLAPKCPVLNEKAFQIVLESSKGTIDVFDGLCNKQKLTYTWVAVHNIFMTGMTYLYVTYYANKTFNENEETVKEYTAKVLNVLRNLIGTCNAAKNCYKMYKTLSAVVVSLKYGSNKNVKNIDAKVTDENDPPNAELFSTIPDISMDNFDIPLEEFFTELEKVSANNLNTGTEQSLVMTDPLLSTGTVPNVPKLDANSFDAASLQGNEDNNLVNLLYQATSHSLWDDFFVKGNGVNSNDMEMHIAHFNGSL